ncbi:MAG: hypothetical protein ACTSUE_25385 [Promethearchaeota archaeon]
MRPLKYLPVPSGYIQVALLTGREGAGGAEGSRRIRDMRYARHYLGSLPPVLLYSRLNEKSK